MIRGLSNLSYSDRLKALDLPTISYHRLRGNLIPVYTYLNNYYDVDWSNNLFHLITEPHYSTRGHKLKLYKHAPNTKLRENFFTIRVINNWNALPEHVVCSTSLNAFKNALDYHWMEKLSYKIWPWCSTLINSIKHSRIWIDAKEETSIVQSS